MRFRERSRGALLNLLEGLEGRVLVLDEAQELRRMGHRLGRLLAYAYDHQKLKVVVSGFQVSLLHRFLRLNVSQYGVRTSVVLEKLQHLLSKRTDILLSLKVLSYFLFFWKPLRISTALSLAVWIKAVFRLNSSLALS